MKSIKLKLIPITKLNKELDEASKIVEFNKFNNVKDTIKYIKNNKVELLCLLDKHYKGYIEKFKGFKIIIIFNNKENRSLTFTYSTIVK